MREYTLTQALSRDSVHAFAGARRLFANWLKRRRLRRVEDLDDHILRDIGVTRGDLLAALKLPLSVDPLWELQRQSRAPRGRRP